MKNYLSEIKELARESAKEANKTNRFVIWILSALLVGSLGFNAYQSTLECNFELIQENIDSDNNINYKG